MPVQLFCLPYSGASASVYARWQRELPMALQVCPVELPGRGSRYAEPLASDLMALARQLARELLPRTGRPYALFGHSLGALLAVEIARALRELGAPAPCLLVASGTEAPSARDDADWAEPLGDSQLLERLRELGGTAPEVLASDELLALILPVLRADFLLCGGYRPAPRAPLNCPIQVFAGRQDSAPMPALLAWQRETHGAFALHWFDGGHFFIASQQTQVLAALAEQVLRHAERGLPA
ncbi:alpha/beta fold hydrolase [Pseudomonas sp. HR96]|uniref:thioesterase II family protein n=1 Tax=Pseudomonas sp. HR96 TaxID=1027966 RepID=UPI002A7652A5|nr:alpha/beta fold hydrolase [Pseudomonas sp. HR96]WPP02037.1 alpha/beta fold hydrolase [Pseudomonas sp. HR96]